MTQINHKDPLELLYDEEIYFPFKLPAQTSTPSAVPEAVNEAPASENIRMASVFLTAPEGKLLDTYEKILLALGRKRTDTPELISLTPTKEDLISFLREKQCNGAVIWGIKPQEIGLSATPYQMTALHEINFLFCDTLSDLENDATKKLKRVLWTELRAHFNKQ